MQSRTESGVIAGTAPTLAATPAGWGNAVRWPAAILALALGLLPLIVTPVLPLIDFYNHVARFQVLATLANNPLFAANYAAAWAILPNVGLDVIAVAALQIVPLALLPHLLTVLILAVLFAGILELNRVITGHVRWPALRALPVFLWGRVLSSGRDHGRALKPAARSIASPASSTPISSSGRPMICRPSAWLVWLDSLGCTNTVPSWRKALGM